MTDTNNTDGAALLPVTPELLPCPFCWTSAHLSYQWPGSMTADMPDRPCRVICSHIDHDTVVGPTGYGKRAAITAWNTRRQSHSLPGDVETLALVAGYADYKAISDDRWEQGKAAGYRELGQLVAAALSSPLPATQEDAERSGVGDDEASQADRDHAMKWINHNMMLATGLMKSSSEAGNGAENFRAHDAYRALKVAKAALSTPQRQEYDGEAVREALERFLADYDDGDRADAGVHPLMEAHIADFRAALAHPAQATPSAVSGGEFAEAFDILVDVQSALVLTADHSQGATVASFVSSSTQYERMNKFLHDRQHSDPRSPSALSPGWTDKGREWLADGAPMSEPVQKLHELPRSNFTLHRATPAGHRPCRHCEQKDPHCSVCEGVGYLPSAVSGDAGEGE